MTLYLTLSEYSWDEAEQRLYLGVSINEKPTPAEDKARRAASPSGAETVTERLIAGSAPLGDPWLRALSVSTLRSGDHGIETVVISAPNLKPRQPFTLDFTLGRNSELSIESKTENVRVVIRSLALSKFALDDSPSLNCRGYLADKNRCRLQADGKHWCAGHREQHELLYVELLKPMSGLVDTREAGFISGEAKQLRVYRVLQQMIALRTIITHLCYGEHNEDEGHGDAVAVLVDARFRLGATMGLRENTGARDAVKTFLFQFLARAETREREFQPGKKTGQCRKTINLQHVRKMLPMLQVAAKDAPTLSEVFCPSSPPALLNGILAVIDSAAVGDLPSLPPPPTFPEPLTMEEIFRLQEEDDRIYYARPLAERLAEQEELRARNSHQNW